MSRGAVVCPSRRGSIAGVSGYDEITVTLPDGYAAYARFWLPRDAKGAVLYHHGIQSHCGWYERSAARLAEAGYAVLQIDRRGSGRNSQDRGHAASAEQLIDDSAAAGDELRKRTGLAAYHSVGVSWGGKLVVAAHVRRPTDALSLTLVTPGMFPIIGVSKQTMAKIGFAMIYEPKRHFEIPLNDPELFTTVPHWQEFFRRDELTLRECTAAFYLASRRMDRIVSDLPNVRSIPVHLFVAGSERIIDNDRTVRFVEGLSCGGKRITTYPAARHSLEFDVAEAYFDAMVAFIDSVNMVSPGGTRSVVRPPPSQ